MHYLDTFSNEQWTDTEVDGLMFFLLVCLFQGTRQGTLFTGSQPITGHNHRHNTGNLRDANQPTILLK